MQRLYGEIYRKFSSDYTQMCGPCGYLEVPSISILELLLLVFLYLNNGMYVIS